MAYLVAQGHLVLNLDTRPLDMPGVETLIADIVCFSDGQVDPKVLPLDEDYDVDPMDSYGLSKVVNGKPRGRFSAGQVWIFTRCASAM